MVIVDFWEWEYVIEVVDGMFCIEWWKLNFEVGDVKV